MITPHGREISHIEHLPFKHVKTVRVRFKAPVPMPLRERDGDGQRGQPDNGRHNSSAGARPIVAWLFVVDVDFTWIKAAIFLCGLWAGKDAGE